MHHSFSYKNGPTLVIDDDSRKELTKFLVRHRIAVMLNGHTHAPNLVDHPFSHLGETVEVYEATCGTSAQRSMAPVGWSRSLDRADQPNTALVHRLWLVDDRRVMWETHVYRQTTRGFVDTPELLYSVPVFP
jgi:hypothetical protein